MRKEYSDLSATQKLVYIKRNIITFTCMFIPLVVVILVFASALSSYQNEIDSLPKSQITNSTINSAEPKTDTDVWLEFKFGVIMILFFATLFGLITLGSALGEWMADKLNLYTDFELESAERKVIQIKKVLESKK